MTVMGTVWGCIAATALASFALKGVGPAVLGTRPLPERARAVISLLAPALLVALVVGELLGHRWRAWDATAAAGVAAAVVARWFRVPTLAALVVGVATTALLRALH